MFNLKAKNSLILMCILLNGAYAFVSSAHSGRTAADGCHYNRKLGTRHCHGRVRTPTYIPPVELLSASVTSFHSGLKKVKISKNYDGDTVSLSLRLNAIDAPEKAQKCKAANGQCYACGTMAADHLARLMNEADLSVSFVGTPSYGRAGARLYNEDRDINLQMVRDGWAVVESQYLLSASDVKRYKGVEELARKNRLGLHQGDFIRPGEWRKGLRLKCEK